MSKKASGDPARKPIGVFLLEDQEIVRRGVRALLEAEPDILVIGEAGTASSALAQIPALRPAVAVLDVRLPDGDGVSVCREVRSRAPEVACLMLTAFSDDEALLASIMAGAAGYVLKQVRGCDLVGAVRMVASGQSLLDPRAAGKVMARLRDEADRRDRLGGLTARERKVLELIGEGLTNRQIGERLSVSVKTVKNYVSVLFVKLGMEQRTQAAAYAARVFDDRRSGLSQDMRIINWKSRERLMQECPRLVAGFMVGRVQSARASRAGRPGCPHGSLAGTAVLDDLPKVGRYCPVQLAGLSAKVR